MTARGPPLPARSSFVRRNSPCIPAVARNIPKVEEGSRDGDKAKRIRHRGWARLAGFGALLIALMMPIGPVLALVSDTGTYDITVPNKSKSAGPLPLAPSGGCVEYIGSSASNQASGTGLFDPFVRLQGSPTEKGYNTNGAVAFDTKPGTWTHAIKVNAIPVVDCDGAGQARRRAGSCSTTSTSPTPPSASR